MKNGQKAILASITVLILIVATSPFLIIFGKQPFSTKLSDWADAATWFSLFTSTITAALLLYLSWQVHEKDKKHKEENILLLKTLEKPTLIFYSERNPKRSNIDKWLIKNIGKGPALNLEVCHMNSKTKEWDNHLVDCYSLSANGESLDLEWLHEIECYALLVFYQDTLTGDKYCALGMNDRTQAINIRDVQEARSQDLVIVNQEIINNILTLKHKRLAQAIEDNTTPPSYTFS